MMRFIIYLKIQCIPFKIYNKYHKFKNDTFLNAIKCEQIDHIINHIFLANDNKIQIIIFNFYISMYVHIFSFKNHNK